MNEEKNQTKIKKEFHFYKIEKKNLYSFVTKSKYNKNNSINNNINRSQINSNAKPKSQLKEHKNKINNLNIKSIIKKIDLSSLTLRKKSGNKNIINSSFKKQKQNEKIKEKISTAENTLIPLNLSIFKAQKNLHKLCFVKQKKNKILINNSNSKDKNHASINKTDQRNRHKNKRKIEKIKLLKLYMKRNNSNYKKDFNTNYGYNHDGRLISERKELYKLIRNDLTIKNTKNTLLYKSDNNIKKLEQNKRRKLKERKSEDKKKLRRINTELGNLNVYLENILNTKYDLDRNNIKLVKKKQTFNKIKDNQLINNNSKDKNVKINKKNIIKKELKNRESGISDNMQSQNNIIHKEAKPKSNQKSKKENYKKRIPKPILSNSKIILEEIYLNHNYNTAKLNNNIIKYKIPNEGRRQFNTELLNKKLEYINSNTEIENSKNNCFNYIKTNFINNSLINIRGFTFPGIAYNGELKLNQDSYIIQRDINYIKNFNIFGVFDGHGFDGHIISDFLKENLIKKIEENPRLNPLTNLNDIYTQFIRENYKLIREIFKEIDIEILNKEKEIDVNLSGSTCTIIIQIGDNIICANVGDSKAILVYEDNNEKKHENNSQYKIVKLSKNCDPYINNERTRILMNGGKIIQLKNDLNQGVGPLRIYIKGKDIPGLTITRSFGDKLGKSIGVISNPFISEYTLNKSVKYIVIASSGVWQYIDEQDLINIGINHYLINDPDIFCKEIYNKSSELWKQNSGYIDDITLIVIFFTSL